MYPFPKRSFGNKVLAQRSFQPSWFDKWPWLYYIESSDAVSVLHVRMQARSQNKLNWSLNMDLAFLSTGFSNWKDATRKFAQHESSKCHTESVLKMLALHAIVYTKYSGSLVRANTKRKIGSSKVFFENSCKHPIFSMSRPTFKRS